MKQSGLQERERVARGQIAPADRTPAMEAEMSRLLRLVGIGLGRIVALHHLLIHFIPDSLTYSVPLFLK